MAEGWSTATATAILDAIFNASDYSIDNVYAQLHVGAPGADGTANPATETTRKAVSMGAASNGSITNDTAVTWVDVAATEEYTHVSLWTAATDGAFIMSGTVTGGAVSEGNTFTLPIGDIDCTLPVAS